MPFLDITDATGRQWRVPLDRPRLLIGREPSCDIHLPHPKVSRRHAQLQRTEQGLWILQDLNSLNHVYVENRPEQQIILEPGKKVRIAEYWLVIQEPSTILEPEYERPAVENLAEFWAGLNPHCLQQLQAFHRALLSADEPRLVLERVAQEFRRIAQPQLAAVGLVTPAGYKWEVIQGEESTPYLQPLLEEAAPRVSAEDSKVQVWSPQLLRGLAGESKAPQCLLFPMKGRFGIIGHVYVQQPKVAPLPAAVEHYLTLLAAHAGLVWDNMQLANLRMAQKEFEHELRKARQIQIELFPATFEVDHRLDVYAVNLPSERVSGDYYDLIITGPDSVGFIIADAMGHGMSAALMMAAVRASLHMGLALGLPWRDVFRGLDEIIARGRADTFVTGIVGHLDLRTWELQLLSAGHPLPSIVVDGRQVPIPRECQMRPWGLPIDSPWEVSRLSLAGADWSILCYTDGITDAGVRAQGTYGSQRVAAFHEAHHRRSAEDLCQGLLNEVAYQPGTTSLGDDQTVLVLRKRQVSA